MRYCARAFSRKDIERIRKIIAADGKRSRSQIARMVCEELKWRKPDGGLKDMSCKVALIRMHRDGIIQLPAPRWDTNRSKAYTHRSARAEPSFPVNIPVHLMSDLRVELVGGKKHSSLWNEYIDRYHYLGYKRLAGAQLRYFARFEGQEVALFGFGASAWHVEARDKFIGWTAEQRNQKRHLVVNNARFLILPWVSSRNLASRLLSLVSKRLPEDWHARYTYSPVLLETFVESRFRGACYRAANWICVGQTKGRGKMDRDHNTKLPRKHIWLYPLRKDFKDILCL